MLRFVATVFGLVVALIVLVAAWPHATHPIIIVIIGLVAGGAYNAYKSSRKKN